MNKDLIHKHLTDSGILNEQEVKNLLEITSLQYLRKGEFLIREGEHSQELAFINFGFLHSYYLSDALEEITYCLAFPGDFVFALSSFISGQQSKINIKALKPAELIVIEKNELLILMQEHPNIEQYFRKMNDQYLLKLENRFFQQQVEDAKTRYNQLLQKYPEFILNLPLRLVASYLGITPRHLSRIRAEH